MPSEASLRIEAFKIALRARRSRRSTTASAVIKETMSAGSRASMFEKCCRYSLRLLGGSGARVVWERVCYVLAQVDLRSLKLLVMDFALGLIAVLLNSLLGLLLLGRCLLLAVGEVFALLQLRPSPRETVVFGLEHR